MNHEDNKSIADENNNREFDISYNTGYTIRGLAMIMIIFVHSINEYAIYTGTFSKVMLIPHYGILGCTLFFFMSGYGLNSSLTLYKGSKIKYLYRHLLKLVIPFAISFAITACLLSLPYLKDISNEIKNIFILSMPDGTDMWFLKAIIIFYIITVALFMTSNNNKTRSIILLILCLAVIAIFNSKNLPGHWYFSILSFPLGFWMQKAAINKKAIRKILAFSILTFAIYYMLTLIFNLRVCLELFGNIAFAFIIVIVVSMFAKGFNSKILIYIGKNSLLFYIFNIPVMLAIPSHTMHWITYFFLNLIITQLVIMVYLPISNRILKSF